MAASVCTAPLEAMVCCGVIGTNERLADGRFNLVLQGVVRARIVQELPSSRLYREVEAEVLIDAPYDGPAAETVRQAVLRLVPLLPGAVEEWVAQVGAAKNGGQLADLVASAVVAEPKRRGRVLDETRVPQRLALVLEDIGALLARLGAQAASGGLKN